MTSLSGVVRAVYVARQLLVRRSVLATRRAWRNVDPSDVRGSWQRGVGDALLSIVYGAQAQAAAQADDAVLAMLAAQDLDLGAGPVLDPSGFAGVASDGRDLVSLLELADVTALRQIGVGVHVEQALAGAGRWLEMVVGTQVSDAARMAAAVSTTARRQVTGWYRVLNPPSCGRCAVLAGRWYRWDAGFERHPRCDCGQIPAGNGALDNRPELWSPRGYFDSLTRAAQDRTFTQAGAAAIRAGADVSQVVNARQGMYTASVGGREVLATRSGATVHGVRGLRLMPEQIFELAGGDRDEALRLLDTHGYLRDVPAFHAPGGVGGGGGGGAIPPDVGPGGGGDGEPSLADLVPTSRPSEEVRAGIEAKLASVVEGTYGPLRVAATTVDALERDFLRWRCGVVSPTGSLAGRLALAAIRTDAATLEVEYEFLELVPAWRRRGFGSVFSAAMEAWYRRSGVDRITLTTGLADGGFVWALRGYQWHDPASPAGVIDRLDQFVRDRAGSPNVVAAAAAMAARLRTTPFDSVHYPTPYDVAILGRVGNERTWSGQQLMRGSRWRGVKLL